MIAKSPGPVNKLKALSLVLAMVFIALARPAAAAEPFVIAPPTSGADLRLLPASAWGPPESDGGDMLLKLSYVRGMIDALAYAQVAPRGASQALEGLRGLNLAEAVAAIDRYYLTDPRRRDLPPAAVLLRVLPSAEATPTPSPSPAPLQAPEDAWTPSQPAGQDGPTP
ncbi:hypothetical protein Deba_0371 [Desulfarculus baarsii DSM 2075]|uniref:Uncharacterized protein n=1 Tax=Desulfarculus baarsii (strain ATCC 33931 / DSM 2075 / LMG 7858 / VKM B-1802 / 2st14) TaxID=644282 RepID=E1QDW0_DESB2|nr:hypothetical protein [Desulfarculus baarsii]ADK83746.1 hypothetical protein Deba_0371 [Desulfarculus baarsii DSM 2075]